MQLLRQNSVTRHWSPSHPGIGSAPFSTFSRTVLPLQIFCFDYTKYVAQVVPMLHCNAVPISEATIAMSACWLGILYIVKK